MTDVFGVVQIETYRAFADSQMSKNTDRHQSLASIGYNVMHDSR